LPALGWDVSPGRTGSAAHEGVDGLAALPGTGVVAVARTRALGTATDLHSKLAGPRTHGS